MLSNTRAVCRSVAVSSLSYRDVSDPADAEAKPEKKASSGPKAPPAPVRTGPTQEEIQAMLDSARRDAVAETEARLQAEFQRELQSQRELIQQAITRFDSERNSYFGKVERDVVELSLSIAAKILHREAQVDPTMIGALARIAIERVNSGSAVTLRVPMKEAGAWRERFSTPVSGIAVEVVGDESLAPGDCWLETTLGSANIGIDNQLKEVEQGFFDLLSRRPDVLA